MRRDPRYYAASANQEPPSCEFESYQSPGNAVKLGCRDLSRSYDSACRGTCDSEGHAILQMARPPLHRRAGVSPSLTISVHIEWHALDLGEALPINTAIN